MAEPSARGGFPTTTQSILFGLHSADDAERARSLERLASAYWKPVYKYVRLRWRKTTSEAEEISQDFFLHAVGKETFHAYDPTKGRFRTFVRRCLDHFVTDRHRHDRAIKRGSGVRPIALDIALDTAAAEAELDGAIVHDPEAFFEQEWVRSLFEASAIRLRAQCAENEKQDHFAVFERLHLTDGGQGHKSSYASVAAELGLSVPEVTYRLQAMRREFRAIVLLTLREVTTSDEEFRSEARHVLGVEL
ncbi:RNA polymerase sigma factor [Pendulispora albinea]|uniref:RNA polymerase sigma-70 region 2 domain-containing protein n=1 Tax=Pendulispora albinea TaxID=2741071 RepID=A0ABZ2M0S0_9BACT